MEAFLNSYSRKSTKYRRGLQLFFECMYLGHLPATIRSIFLLLSRTNKLPSPLRKKLYSLGSVYESSYEASMLPYMKISDGAYVDVGAGLGENLMRIAEKGLTVYAFEPKDSARKALQEKTEHLPNVHVFGVALTDKAGKVPFFLIGDDPERQTGLMNYPSRVFTYHAEDTVKKIWVCTRTLDSFKFRNLSLVKIDVDGAELAVLKGSVKTLSEQKPTVVCEVNHPMWITARDIISLFSHVGYKHVKRVCHTNFYQFYIVAKR